jgi:hypothetical protein
MKLTLALVLATFSFAALADVTVPCTFQDYQALSAALNDTAVAKREVSKGLISELTSTLEQEMGPQCDQIIHNGPSIPEERRTIYQVGGLNVTLLFDMMTNSTTLIVTK